MPSKVWSWNLYIPSKVTYHYTMKLSVKIIIFWCYYRITLFWRDLFVQIRDLFNHLLFFSWESGVVQLPVARHAPMQGHSMPASGPIHQPLRSVLPPRSLPYSLDGEMTKTKVLDLNEFSNYVVDNFFHLKSFNVPKFCLKFSYFEI